MKRKAKQNGSGGRLRLGLLMAAAAAFLLVPAAAAYAAEDAVILGNGEGSGWIKGSDPESGGIPYIECHWNGELGEWDVGTKWPEESGVPGLNNCGTEAQELGGLTGISVEREADEGSEFVIWDVQEGAVASGCGSQVGCAVVFPPIKIEVTFDKIPLPEFPLNVTTSGSAGSVECKIGGGSFEACPAEVEETTPVELKAVPGVGSALTEWTSGPCAGESTNPCAFTMPAEEVNANAEFSVATYTFSVNKEGEGEGSVECEVNSGGLGACPTEATHGDTIKVVATPAAENLVESLTGSGSAAGSCSIAGEGESGECEFTIEADSAVTVVFESAGTKDQVEGNVEGEVPITTSLEGCEVPVVLGPFLPGVADNYLGNCGLTVTSTGNETELTASDETGEDTGHLVQPPYKLPSALQTRANGLGGLEFPGVGGPFEPLTSPVTLLAYGGPVSADNVTVFFRQHIGLHDALHTGTYAKTITLTLEQTTP